MLSLWKAPWGLGSSFRNLYSYSLEGNKKEMRKWGFQGQSFMICIGTVPRNRRAGVGRLQARAPRSVLRECVGLMACLVGTQGERPGTPFGGLSFCCRTGQAACHALKWALGRSPWEDPEEADLLLGNNRASFQVNHITAASQAWQRSGP